MPRTRAYIVNWWLRRRDTIIGLYCPEGISNCSLKGPSTRGQLPERVTRRPARSMVATHPISGKPLAFQIDILRHSYVYYSDFLRGSASL